MQRIFRLPILLVLVAVTIGCSDDDRACTPGITQPCFCPGGSKSGVQTCDQGGKSWGKCDGCGITKDAAVPDQKAVPDLKVVADLPKLDKAVLDMPPPDRSWPDKSIPDAPLPDLTVPDKAVPDLLVPDLPAPDLPVPDLPVPDLPAPDQALPDQTPVKCTSLAFKGNDKVIVKNNKGLDLGVYLSITAWVKMTQKTQAVVIHTGLSGPYCGPYNMTFSKAGNFNLQLRGGTGAGKCNPQVNATSVGKAPLNKWTHVAAVYENTKVMLYMNGKLDSSKTVVPVNPYPPIHDLWIGKGDGPHIGLVGNLSNVQLWARALSGPEVKQAMAGIVTNKTGLVGHWEVSEGTGNTMKDLSPKGNHGAVAGATWSKDAPFCGP